MVSPERTGIVRPALYLTGAGGEYPEAAGADSGVRDPVCTGPPVTTGLAISLPEALPLYPKR